MKTPAVLLATLLLSICLPAAALEQWVYLSSNLLVDKNVTAIEALFARAGKAGYTHVLIADSKFSKLDEMDPRYFRNVERVKKLAAENRLELVPALFGIGYSNDLLWKDPNLIEGLPVREVLFVVDRGVAVHEPSTSVSLKGHDFSDLKKWSWHDPTVTLDDGAALIMNPKGKNARLSQKITLMPFRQYHLTIRIKTEDFRGTPEVKVLAGKASLNHRSLGVKPTQDWSIHHVTFNSLSNETAQLYLGAWDAQTGSLWFDDATLNEVALVNIIRRPGAPLVVRTEEGKALREGMDFQRVSDRFMGTRPWKGEYDVYHEPPVLRALVPDGTKLRVSYYHAATVHDGQANICPSEPATLDLLRAQAERVHRAWNASRYMMSHDEIRVYNWCEACQSRKLDAGALLAENVRECIKILRKVNPGGRIYVWSDMFDPHHNARKDYYLVRGDYAGSWEGLDKDVAVIPWYFEKRAESLRFFANRGHRQVIAGYYDHEPGQVREWLKAAANYSGVEGVMYTTWKNDYADLEAFAEAMTQTK